MQTMMAYEYLATTQHISSAEKGKLIQVQDVSTGNQKSIFAASTVFCPFYRKLVVSKRGHTTRLPVL